MGEKRRRNAINPYWMHNPIQIVHSKPSLEPRPPLVEHTTDIKITDRTISFVGPVMDCAVEKMVKEYIPYFQKEGYQTIFTLQKGMQDIIRFTPRWVVLFRCGTNPAFGQELGMSNITRIIKHLQRVGVRVVYYLDDFLVEANHSAPVQIAALCDAVIVSTSELRDLFSKISNFTPPIIHVPTHIDLNLFDYISNLDYISKIDRYKVLISSGGRVGATLLHDICEIANDRYKEFEDVEWIINSASVAQMRTLINRFRNLNKTYLDWLSLEDYYRLCKSVNLILNPASKKDIAVLCSPQWQEAFINSKSAVKYTIAGAAKLPCISSPMRSYIEAIKEGDTGYIVNSSEEFIDKILYLKNNPEIAETVGKTARKDIEENYSMAKRFPLYRDAIIGNYTSIEEHITIPVPKQNTTSVIRSEPTPETAVIIPNYNYAKFIGESIQSALNINPPVSEIIIVDDHSTDNSVEIIKQYHDKYPNRIQYTVLDRNYGHPGVALNTAMKMSRSKYIVGLASDDTICPDYFTIVLPKFNDPKIGVVRIPLNTMGLTSELMVPIDWASRDRVKDLLITNRVFGPSCFRKEVWEDVGGFDNDLHFDDWDFWIKAAINGWEFADVSKAVYNYRLHMASLSHDQDKHLHFKNLATKYIDLIKEKNVVGGLDRFLDNMEVKSND